MITTLYALADDDPVASAVAEHWGVREATGLRVGDGPVRDLGEGRGYMRRPGLHIHDDRLDADLAAVPGLAEVTVIFPSIHRSESGTACFTVHPLGNLGPDAEVGGRPFTVVPAAARAMTDTLRRLSEAGGPLGLGATFEATHHGPMIRAPAFFAEIGYGEAPAPPEAAARALARVLPDVGEDPKDRIVVGVGGGHYVPHFTDLALRRRWAFGHLVSRHALERATRAVLDAAVRATPGAEGILYARAADAEHPKLVGLAPRRRDGEAPHRGREGEPTPSASSRPSGT